MIVKSINLKDYRNYELLNIELSDKTNIIYGDNAQGKTNILESMYVGATTKSHRGSKDKELIRFGCDEAHIKMIVCRNDIDYRIDMHIKKNKAKGIAVNGIPLKRSVELFGIVNMVFFSPEDLNIIKDVRLSEEDLWIWSSASLIKFMCLILCSITRFLCSAISCSRI